MRTDIGIRSRQGKLLPQLRADRKVESGWVQAFPEAERAEWFTIAEARTRILPAQEPLLDRWSEWLVAAGSGPKVPADR